MEPTHHFNQNMDLVSHVQAHECLDEATADLAPSKGLSMIAPLLFCAALLSPDSLFVEMPSPEEVFQGLPDQKGRPKSSEAASIQLSRVNASLRLLSRMPAMCQVNLEEKYLDYCLRQQLSTDQSAYWHQDAGKLEFLAFVAQHPVRIYRQEYMTVFLQTVPWKTELQLVPGVRGVSGIYKGPVFFPYRLDTARTNEIRKYVRQGYYALHPMPNDPPN